MNTGTTIEQSYGLEVVYLAVSLLPFVMLFALMLGGRFEETFRRHRPS